MRITHPYPTFRSLHFHENARRADYQGRAFVYIYNMKWLPAYVREQTAECGLYRPNCMRIIHVKMMKKTSSSSKMKRRTMQIIPLQWCMKKRTYTPRRVARVVDEMICI